MGSRNTIRVGTPSGFSESRLLVRIVRVFDAIIVISIALGQLVLSIFVLLFIFTSAYMGGLQPVAGPYMLFGIISASILFSCRLTPRLIAMVWQGFLVGTVLFGVAAKPVNSHNIWLKNCALFILPSALYLLVTAAVQFYWRKSNQPPGAEGTTAKT